MKYLFKFEEYLVAIEKALIIALIFLMIGLSCLQLTLRLAFHSGVVWLDPLLRHMVLWSGFTGTALASRYSRHFALDALTRFVPAGFRRMLEILAGLFTVSVSAALFYAACKFLKDEFLGNSAAFYIGNFPVRAGYMELMVPVIFALIIFHVFLNIFRKDGPSQL